MDYIISLKCYDIIIKNDYYIPIYVPLYDNIKSLKCDTIATKLSI